MEKCNEDGYKSCPKCKTIKSADCFHYAEAKKDGLSSWCKDCCSKYSKQHKPIYNKEKERERYQKRKINRTEEDKQRQRESTKRYRTKNKDKINAEAREKRKKESTI